MKRIPVIIALFLAVPLIAVAQHQQGNVANVPDQKFDTATHCICLADGNHHCSIIGLSPGTQLACETVGGTWVMPHVVPGPILSDFASVSVGHLVSVGDAKVSKDFHQSVDVDSQTGRVVKLSDDEYARLQKLRQSVADEEKKIAQAHGVDTEGDMYPCGKDATYGMMCGIIPEWKPRYPDRWQFRGQWLFINVPRKETK